MDDCTPEFAWGGLGITGNISWLWGPPWQCYRADLFSSPSNPLPSLSLPLSLPLPIHSPFLRLRLRQSRAARRIFLPPPPPPLPPIMFPPRTYIGIPPPAPVRSSLLSLLSQPSEERIMAFRSIARRGRIDGGRLNWKYVTRQCVKSSGFPLLSLQLSPKYGGFPPRFLPLTPPPLTLFSRTYLPIKFDVFFWFDSSQQRDDTCCVETEMEMATRAQRVSLFCVPAD